MQSISKHISYVEAIHSDVAKRLGIDNNPNDKQLLCMQDLATRIFEPIREHFGVPIYVSSFFRSGALNKLLRGATSSQHLKGEAMDIDADVLGGVTNKEIFTYIKDNLIFDQLIAENIGKDGTGGWIHVSLRETNNRNEVLSMSIIDGKKYYEELTS